MMMVASAVPVSMAAWRRSGKRKEKSVLPLQMERKFQSLN